ncbi:hypothetical protein AAGF08_13530 [Algoriphagus sp. SE2]|uniref:glycoside hydrolase family 113 n=1 Tax=Algoriphagus sp. SE2 TaxID=3141536 RepID=UPI0031CD78CE
MKPWYTRYLLSSIAVFIAFAMVWWMIPEEEILVAVEKWKGVCWVGSRSPLDGTELRNLKSTGANALSQTPFGWQSEVNKPEIRWEVNAERQWWGESARGIQATHDSSQVLGIMNMLKPHLWVRGSWPGDIEMLNEGDWDLWFDNYKGFILDYAKLAEELKIPMLCIGTELEKTSEREEEWRKIISEIRKVYSGKLVYAANFTEFEKIKFWDKLDYIGVQAYFPLTDKHNPDLDELKSGWEKQLPKIEKVVRKYKKPVLFTEIGYCNTIDAAIEPWVWPNERKEIEFSEEAQALCYEAFFETAWKKTWMAGVFFWKWYPKRHEREPDFTPQGKAAEAVMARYFLDD